MNLHKFLTKKHKNIVLKLNQVLRSLIDVDFKRYQKNTNIIVEAVKRQDICDYQSQLLSAAFNSFKLDIDYLTFTIKCSSSVISKLTNEQHGLLNVKAHGAKDIISVKSVKVGAINKDFIRNESKQGPIYILAYLIMVNGNDKQAVRVHISTGCSEHSTIGIRFSYNPKHFTRREICAVFLHVESIVGKRSYDSLINKARVTRIDIGLIVFGLCNLFVYGFVTDKRFTRSECFSKSDNGVAETTWVGMISKIRIYDKTLEMLTNLREAEQLFGQWAMSTRFEYENRAKGRLSLNTLEKSSQLFANLQVIDPKVLPLLPTHTLKRLLLKKTNTCVKRAFKTLGKLIGAEVPTISLDKARLHSETNRVLGDYKKLILEPRKMFKRYSK